MIATKDDLMALLTIARFAAWLSAKPEDAIVGRACEADGCPLARYLVAQDGASPFVTVDGAAITMTTPEAHIRIPTPRWGAVFVAAVDSGSPEPDITACYAEYVLLHIRREVAQ